MTPDPDERPPPTRGHHLEILLVCSAVLLAAPMLDVRPGGRVGARHVPEFVLPPSCASREMLGIDCPGCGLTRSFVHLARGDWASSVEAHRLGWVLFALAAYQVPYRLDALWGRDRLRPGDAAAKWAARLVIAGLMLNWLLKLAGA